MTTLHSAQGFLGLSHPFVISVNDSGAKNTRHSKCFFLFRDEKIINVFIFLQDLYFEYFVTKDKHSLTHIQAHTRRLNLTVNIPASVPEC